jgi:hypothetical protein
MVACSMQSALLCSVRKVVTKVPILLSEEGLLYER